VGSLAESTRKRRTKLRYLPDSVPGYGRVKRGRGFYYVDCEGNRITDKGKLERLRALVIPPAWKSVWISPSKRGHLQATGVDEEGRKQYSYHPAWTAERQQKKLKRMVAFGKVLPHIRQRIDDDLQHGAFVKEKAIALALKIMEETLMRVGNEQYRRRYGSHGLTTLKKKHLHISKNTLVFRFRGKKGVWQEISVCNAKLAADLSEMRQLPGAYLFQYIDEEGKKRRLDAADINGYIQQHADGGFSSKDYRTWYAGVWAFRLFAQCMPYASERECRANILSVLDVVSQRLGNTRTVCKQYYVPDRLIGAYEDGTLLPYLQRSFGNGAQTVEETERQLLAFLRQAVSSDTC